MGYELKTNTAIRIAVGPLVDPTDGKTAETGLTVTDLSVQIYQIKTDGSAVVRTQFTPTASGGNNDMALVTSSTDGMYDLELTAAQLNFLGTARISLYDVDGFLVHYIDLSVVSANYFDNKYGSTIETVNMTQLGSSTQSATDLKDFADAGYDPATNKVQGVVLTDTCTTNTDMVGTDNAALASVCTEARLAELDAANLPTDIADIPTVAEFNARTLPSADYVVVTDTIAGVTLVDTCTTNTDMVGTDNAALASVCTEARLAELDAANLPTDISSLNDISVADIIAGIADGTYDLQEMMRIMFTALAGRSSGGGTATLVFKEPTNVKTRITATVDADGNRTAITLDGS